MRSYFNSALHMRFCTVFKQLQITQKDFGEKLGLSQNQISTILSEKSKITEPTLRLLKHEFQVNPDYLLKGANPMFLPPKIRYVPILSDIPSGSWELWFDEFAAGNDYVAAPSDIQGENLFAVRMKDDSMEPILHRGDILVIDPQKRFIKGIAVVQYDGRCNVRTVHEFDQKYLLTPYNFNYPEEDIARGPDTHVYVPVKTVSVRDIQGTPMASAISHH